MNQRLQNNIEFRPIIERRKWPFIIVCTIIFTFSLVIALIYPPSYKSSATILIEEQEIPQNFVMSTITSYAEQRLQMINQKIMSYSQLHKLIDKFNLYPKLKSKLTDEQILEKMRDDIKMNMISAELLNHQTGRSEVTTIAFQLSYVGENAQQAYMVATDLTTLFLEENIKVRTQQTKEASSFLEEEMKKVKTYLSELDVKIKDFKRKHIHELPEFIQTNVQMLSSSDRNVDMMNERLRQLVDREKYLVTQLSSLSPDMDFNTDQHRLEELRVLLVTLKSKFSDQYPDVIRTKKEIERLEKYLSQDKNKISDSSKINPDNPNYVAISSQLEGVRGEINEIRNQIRSEFNKKNLYNKRIESTSAIEGEYNALITEQTNAKNKYNDLNRKLMEANVAHGLEQEQKGERFTLIDPAKLPEKPFKPNRMIIIVLGAIFSVAVSAGFVFILEFTNDYVYDTQSLENMTKIPVLCEIPLIRNKNEIEQMNKRKYWLISGMTLSVIAGFLILHYCVIDLDILWAKIIRKLV